METGLLRQRVDEPGRHDLHLVHVALQEQVAREGRNRPRSGNVGESP